MSHPDDGVLQELLDGELTTVDETAVRAHLASCAACSARLEELRSTQAEADFIVARLDLDPPLRPPVSRRTGERRINLRLLALAASTVLVAGTSWVLLRSTAPGASFGRSNVDAVRPEGRLEDRNKAPAAALDTPAVPASSAPPRQAKPAPRRPADEKKTVADAAPARAAPETVVLRQKEEEATPAANAAGIAVAPLLRQQRLTAANAGELVGWKVRTIEGLAPQSVELVRSGPDSTPAVLSRYRVGEATVALLQQPASRSDDALGGGRSDEAATQLSAEAKPLEKSGKDRPAMPASALAAKAATGPMVSTRVWQSDGVRFELSGAIPVDSLDALMGRVR